MIRRATCPARPAAPPAPPVPAPAIDLSLNQARPVMVGVTRALQLILVGCGGSGSWLAPAVVRIAKQYTLQGGDVDVLFVDPDIVEPANTVRQNFCQAEVGRYKAETLAMRYGAAWGLTIDMVAAPFDRQLITGMDDQTVAVLIGCVDNAAARKSIHAAFASRLKADDGSIWSSRLWWLDCGNSRTSGQVLLGSTLSSLSLSRAFVLPDRCNALPAPSLQHPELLIPRPEELDPADTGLSCEEMAARNAQSLTVNQMVAAVAADYLVGLVLSRSLKAYATYFELAAHAMRSKYITPDAIARFVAKAPSKRPRQRAPAPAGLSHAGPQ